jgi:hypothetical protein
MKRLAMMCVLLLCMWPASASADDGSGMWVLDGGVPLRDTVVIDEGPPKGVIGFGVRCEGVVTQGGVTLRQVEYSGMDDAEYGKDAAREEQWSRDNCKWQLEQGMAGYFRWTLGQELDVSRIRVTYRDV